MDLTTGKLDNGYTVVCVLSQGEQNCNKDNLLFTLNQQNAQNPNAVFIKMTNFVSGKASNSTIDETGELHEYLRLEHLVDNAEWIDVNESEWIPVEEVDTQWLICTHPPFAKRLLIRYIGNTAITKLTK